MECLNSSKKELKKMKKRLDLYDNLVVWSAMEKRNNYSFMKNMEKLKNLLMGLGLATILYVLMLMMFVLNETGSGFWIQLII